MSKPKVVHHEFDKDQYYPNVTEKSQIFLHHTVSGVGVAGDINWWEQTPEHVATCVIIARDGTIHTLYRSEVWAHHLGVKIKHFDKYGVERKFRKSVKSGKMFVSNNVELNEGSIGLELDSWGGLTKKGSKFYGGSKEIPIENVVDYGKKIRGFQYYEKYTTEQIRSLIYLCKYWNDKYKIPIHYRPEMWEISVEALRGTAGLWAHVSVRPDKSDCHPQPELIEALKAL
tara:strand:+ start:8387 stop:9073 length:687 start_codon:yes stop_codon:yes gene_type:complete